MALGLGLKSINIISTVMIANMLGKLKDFLLISLRDNTTKDVCAKEFSYHILLKQIDSNI